MDVASYISVALTSAIKFIGGPILGAALRLSWIETALSTIAGMMGAVVIVTFVGRAIQRWLRQRSTTKPTLFNKRTRVAVSIWKRFGIIGIACLTPLFFTPIGGTLIALSFKVPPQRLLLPMLFFATFWALVFTLLIYNIPAVKQFVS